MVGNAAEWVQPENGRYSFRGGSFMDVGALLLTYTRFVCKGSDFNTFFLGFRCVKDVR